MGNLNNKFSLTYFDARGRAELSRMILAAAGVQFKDNRIQFKDWPAMKNTTVLGQMPFLEFEGQVLPQSMTIARFLARETNLAGKNNAEQAKADAIVDSCSDGFNGFMSKVFSIKDQNAKDEASKKFFIEDLPKHLGNLEKLIGLWGSNGYSVGNSLTWADLSIYEYTYGFWKKDASLDDKFPNIRKVRQSVESHPKLSVYLRNRPETPF